SVRGAGASSPVRVVMFRHMVQAYRAAVTTACPWSPGPAKMQRSAVEGGCEVGARRAGGDRGGGAARPAGRARDRGGGTAQPASGPAGGSRLPQPRAG